MREKVANGLRMRYAVIEFVVDILHVHQFGTRTPLPVETGKRLDRGDQVRMGDDEIIPLIATGSKIRRPIEHDGRRNLETRVRHGPDSLRTAGNLSFESRRRVAVRGHHRCEAVLAEKLDSPYRSGAGPAPGSKAQKAGIP